MSSSSEETEILVEYRKQLLLFFDELIGQFPHEGDLVVARLFLANQIQIKDVMDMFLFKLTTNDSELKKMVKERNERFFLEHSLFDKLGKEKANHFKKLWRSGQLDNEDKAVIWNWIDAFVYLSEKYAKTVGR